MSLSASVVGLIGPLGVGWLWDAALASGRGTRPLPGMVYWLGLMTLGALIILGHGMGLSQTLVLSLVALVVTAGWVLRLRRSCKEAGGWLQRGLPFLPLAFAGIGYCVVDPVRVWDSYLIWLARVRLLEQWIPLSQFQDLRIIYPEYPFLGAAIWWWVDWAARVPVEAGRVVFLFAYLAFFLAVLARQEPRGGRRFRLVCLFLAYTCFSLQIINGYQDGLLMVSTGMVALAFLHWGDHGVAWIPALAAGLSLIKAEGAILGLILVFCWFVSRLTRSKAFHADRLNRRTLLLGALGFALVLAAWPWLQARNGLDATNVQGDAFQTQSIEAFIGQADRVPTILSEIARDYAWRPWIAIPFLAAVVSASISGKRLDRGRRFLLGFVMLHLVFVTIVFWATQMPFEWHLGSALHRLLLHGRLVMLLFVFETAAREWAPLFEGWPSRHRVSMRTIEEPGRPSWT